MAKDKLPEPWLRGTLLEVDAVRRHVLHAFELAAEDIALHTDALSAEDLHARPFGIASVAYHLRHIVGSLDRLLTYAEGRQLSAQQLAALAAEMEESATPAELSREVGAGLEDARQRVLNIAPETFEQPREVGRQRLPATVGGLLVHCAEHTQRHAGQAITTARVVAGLRTGTQASPASSRPRPETDNRDLTTEN